MATVAAEGRHDAADHGGGVVAGGLQQGGHQGAGGGLAVAAGHGDRGLAGDQGRQHIGAVTEGIAQPAGFLHLWVALGYGGAEHHEGWRGCCGITPGRSRSDRVNGGGVLLVEDAHAGLVQGRGHGVVAGVGAADAEAAAREDHRQGRHADPAYADEMERLLAVELQAQGHLRWSAENTAPDGFCRVRFFTNFIPHPFCPFVVPQSGWGDGPSQGLDLSARTGDWAPWCRPARVRPPTFQRSLSRRVLKSFSAGLPGVFAAWEAELASTARLDQPRPRPRPGPEEQRRDFCMIGARITPC